MRAVLLRVPETMLDARHRLGHDRWDEVWEGVLHMVPPPSDWHQRFGTRLLLVLAPLAERRGLEASYETGVFRPSQGEIDYRVPDLVFAEEEQRSERGVEGRAEVVIEILSPDDESHAKLDFYADLGVCEVWIVDPHTRTPELYVLRGNRYHAVVADARGVLHSPALGVSLTTIEGPNLRLSWSDGERDI